MYTTSRRELLQRSARAAFTAVTLGSGITTALAACAPSRPAASIESSDQLFQAGRFAEADQAYVDVLAREPNNARAFTQRGHIALLGNRLADAQRLLEQANKLAPEDQQTSRLLALTAYRADDFARAAQLGYQPQLLQSLAGRTPYQTIGPDSTQVRLLQATPLLLVEVALQGLEPVPFVIDTGSTSILLHPELAERAGVTLFSPPAGARAVGTGGQQIDPGQLARIDDVRIGDFEVHNIPGSTTTSIARGVRAPDGRAVEGAIGTTLLAHFLATLDYPGATLVLRRPSPDARRQVEEESTARAATHVPLWLYTDHLILVQAMVNGRGPFLVALDTGANTDYGSLALLPTEQTAQDAGIQVDKTKTMPFVGSGGESTVYPIQADEVALGGAMRRNVPGAVGVWPSRQLSFGVEPSIGGAVSSGFLSAFAVTLDFAGMRLFLAGAAHS